MGAEARRVGGRAMPRVGGQRRSALQHVTSFFGLHFAAEPSPSAASPSARTKETLAGAIDALPLFCGGEWLCVSVRRSGRVGCGARGGQRCWALVAAGGGTERVAKEGICR